MNKQSMRCDLKQTSQDILIGMPLHPHACCAAEEGVLYLAKLRLVEHCVLKTVFWMTFAGCKLYQE